MPTLSIITVNLNNASGLRKTIESVAGQSFTDYEYIIIDGGSTDGSVEVIKEFEDKIAYWVSEPDDGIYFAMNKGIREAKGNFLYFLGSDDNLYSKDVLSIVAKYTGGDTMVIYGNVLLKNKRTIYAGKFDFFDLTKKNICHQSIFFNKVLFDIFGYYDTKYRILSDWAFNFNWINHHKKVYLPIIIAEFNELGLSGKYSDSDQAFFKDLNSIIKATFIRARLFQKLKFLIKKVIY